MQAMPESVRGRLPARRSPLRFLRSRRCSTITENATREPFIASLESGARYSGRRRPPFVASPTFRVPYARREVLLNKRADRCHGRPSRHCLAKVLDDYRKQRRVPNERMGEDLAQRAAPFRNPIHRPRELVEERVVEPRQRFLDAVEAHVVVA